MPTLEQARELARLMVDIGVDAGRDMVAVISDMNQPLGMAVGNALEVAEAIDALKGGGPADLRAHCVEIASHMLRLAGQGERWADREDIKRLLEEHLDGGAAFARFRRMVEAQGGDVRMVDDPPLPQSALPTIEASRSAFVAQIDARRVGWRRWNWAQAALRKRPD
jgi:pyrimidine-nucleoside phosphorylase